MRRHIRIPAAVTLLALGLSGCTAPPIVAPSAPANNPSPASAPIVLGAIYNLTGGQAVLDVPSAKGAQLAVDQVNAGGGLLGRPVELVLKDGETDQAVIRAAATAILEKDPSTAALFGFSDTDPVLAVAPVAADSGRVFLTSGATSPKLPEEAPGYVFLACFGDNVQAAAGAEWAYENLSARTVSILYTGGSTYAGLLQAYFRTRFEELGGKVASVQAIEATGAAAAAAAAAKLQPADLVYLAATPDEALDAVHALRAASYDGPILGGDGLDVAGLWEQHPEVSQVYYTTHVYLGPNNDDPAVAPFRKAYSEAYPNSPPDAFAALGYDAARLLMEAISQAGRDDPEAVRSALQGISEFHGVTGQIGFPPGSQIPVKSVAILAADNGSLRLAEQLIPVQVPAP